MKHIRILLLISFTLPLLLAQAAYAQSPGISYVFTPTASLWKEPGYSWRDCDRIHQKDAISSMDQLIKTSENCDRTYLQSGEEVMVLNDGKKLKSVDKEILIEGQKRKMKFYYVEVTVKDADGTTHRERGWMSADQILEPEQDKEDFAETTEQKPPPKRNCPPVPRKEPVREAQKNAKEIKDHLANQLALGPVKSDREVDHFLCLYRKKDVSDAQFDKMIPRFSKAAKKAEASFQVPYSVTMCTMLIESGLYYNSSENDEYKGLGQFGSAMVEDLGKLVKDPKSSFGQKWNHYTNRSLTDNSVRNSYDPEAATGAVALMMNWIYENRIPAAKCRDCSRNDQLNRRDLYLMVAGYNYSPYALDKIANRPLSQIRASFPPPRETRNYMTQMDRCLEKGQEKKFRVGKDDKKEVISKEYKERKMTCDQKYPVK